MAKTPQTKYKPTDHSKGSYPEYYGFKPQSPGMEEHYTWDGKDPDQVPNLPTSGSSHPIGDSPSGSPVPQSSDSLYAQDCLDEIDPVRSTLRGDHDYSATEDPAIRAGKAFPSYENPDPQWQNSGRGIMHTLADMGDTRDPFGADQRDGQGLYPDTVNTRANDQSYPDLKYTPPQPVNSQGWTNPTAPQKPLDPTTKANKRGQKGNPVSY